MRTVKQYMDRDLAILIASMKEEQLPSIAVEYVPEHVEALREKLEQEWTLEEILAHAG